MRIPSLNPMKLVSRNSLTQLVKVGGGIYAYQLISSQVQTPWMRWASYGALALGGVYAPLALFALNKIYPVGWSNLDNQPSSHLGKSSEGGLATLAQNALKGLQAGTGLDGSQLA